MTNLFVYGTLQAEEVLKALIGRVPVMRSGDTLAHLHDKAHKRRIHTCR